MVGAEFSEEYLVQQFTIEHGLTDNIVNALIQDQKGFIWIGTNDGLNRFDGYQFKKFKYQPGDQSSISHNRSQVVGCYVVVGDPLSCYVFSAHKLVNRKSDFYGSQFLIILSFISLDGLLGVSDRGSRGLQAAQALISACLLTGVPGVCHSRQCLLFDSSYSLAGMAAYPGKSDREHNCNHSLCLVGGLILLVSFSSLGVPKSFGIDKNKLKTDGLYRYSRNPQLLGYSIVLDRLHHSIFFLVDATLVAAVRRCCPVHGAIRRGISDAAIRGRV